MDEATIEEFEKTEVQLAGLHEGGQILDARYLILDTRFQILDT